MKKTVLMLFAAAAMSMMLGSCGKSLQTNDRLGKVVSLMQEAQDKEADWELKAKDCKDAECLGKLMDEAKNWKEQQETKLKTEIESLKGKEIPAEVKNLPIKLSKPLTIAAMNSFKRPQCETEIEFTKDVTLNTIDEFYNCTMLISFMDKEMHSLGNTMQSLIPQVKFEKGMVIKAGSKFPVSFDLMISKKNLEKWQNFDKIVFESNPKK